MEDRKDALLQLCIYPCTQAIGTCMRLCIYVFNVRRWCTAIVGGTGGGGKGMCLPLQEIRCSSWPSSIWVQMWPQM